MFLIDGGGDKRKPCLPSPSLPPSFLLNFQLSRQPRVKSFATQANFSYELIPFPDRRGKKVIFCYNHVQNNVKTNVFVYKKKKQQPCAKESLTSVCSSNVAIFISARFVLTLIRVACLSIDSFICFDVLECVIHKPPLAAMVAIASRAVNKVLFTERDELSSFLEVLSFQWSCCTESPARTALTWETEEYKSTIIIIFEGKVRRNSIKPWIGIIIPCVAGAGLGKFEDTRPCAKGEMEALGGIPPLPFACSPRALFKN